MHRRFQAILFIVILTLLYLLVSCVKAPEVIHILTDRKELTTAIELYDAAHDDLIITMRHVSAVDASLIDSENPDIVIAADLSAAEIILELQTLDAPYDGYQAIEGPKNSRSQSYLLPLSFQLPLIMGLSSTMDSLPDASTVRPEELRKAASRLRITDEEGRITSLGFSPSWDPESFVDLWMARDPKSVEKGIEGVDNEDIREIVIEAGEWIFESVGSAAADEAFNTKYRYVPDEKLLNNKRILFARTDLESWAKLPDSISGMLDIRYFRGERSIPVLSIVSAGIPKHSGNKESAEEFLSWLRAADTQELLMSRWERDGITVFGFFGGLSAEPSVNQGILLDRYPEMKGMIPEAHYLDGPESVPHRWKRIRIEVVAPWFAEAAAREADNLKDGTEVSGPTLSEAYRTWDLSSLTESD